MRKTEKIFNFESIIMESTYLQGTLVLRWKEFLELLVGIKLLQALNQFLTILSLSYIVFTLLTYPPVWYQSKIAYQSNRWSSACMSSIWILQRTECSSFWTKLDYMESYGIVFLLSDIDNNICSKLFPRLFAPSETNNRIE